MEKKEFKINVLGVSGSPRKEHNTDRAVKAALESAERMGKYVETKFINVTKFKIKPCLGCLRCFMEGKREAPCPMIKDDMNKEIYPMVFWADVILIGTPVYWGTPCAQIKTFMDRFTPFTHGPATELRGGMDRKVSGAIATSLDVHGGAETSIVFIHQWAHVLDMTVVAAGPHHPHGSYIGGAVHTQPYWGPDMWKHDIFGTRSVHGVAQRAVELATYLKLGEEKAKEMGEDVFRPNLKPSKGGEVDWDEYFKISAHMPTVHYSVPGVWATSTEAFDKYVEWMDPKKLKERKGEAFAESSHTYLDPKKFRENWKKLNVKFVTDDELLQIDPEYFAYWQKNRK